MKIIIHVLCLPLIIQISIFQIFYKTSIYLYICKTNKFNVILSTYVNLICIIRIEINISYLKCFRKWMYPIPAQTSKMILLILLNPLLSKFNNKVEHFILFRINILSFIYFKFLLLLLRFFYPYYLLSCQPSYLCL